MKKIVIFFAGLLLLVGCANKQDMSFYGIDENKNIVIAVFPAQQQQYRMVSLRIDRRDLGDYRNMRLTHRGRQLTTADGEICFVKSSSDMTEIRRGIKYSRVYTPLSNDEMRERLTKLIADYKNNAETWLVYDYSIQIELVNKILETLPKE